MSNDTDPKGPWIFELPELQPGESWVLDAENREYNGRKGWFRKMIPFDYAQVTNQSTDSSVRVVYNGIYEDLVVPNAIEAYDDMGITEVRIFNAGSTAIGADDVVLSVGVEGYTADDRARDLERRGPVGDLVDKFTGLSINGI